MRAGAVGRPSYRPLAMLKALLLQRWCKLSDEGLGEALSDRLPFRRFCGFALNVLKRARPDISIRRKRKRCGWSDAFARSILGQMR